MVLKAPLQDIESVRGVVPIGLQHALYDCPTAPVIRMLTTIYDRPGQPLKFETFVNVGDEQQRADFAALGAQDALFMLFYDQGLTHRLTKQVQLPQPQVVDQVLELADRLRAAIADDQFDFDRAKQAVMDNTTL